MYLATVWVLWLSYLRVNFEEDPDAQNPQGMVIPQMKNTPATRNTLSKASCFLNDG